MLKSDAQHWGGLAKAFHWTIVVLIIAQAVVGLYMVDLPKRPSSFVYYNFHKSVGMTVLALAVLRLVWRAFDARPAEPAGTPHWQALAARAGHALLYGLLFAVPLSGWWFDSLSGLRPLYFFGLFEIPHLVAPNTDMKDLGRDAHEWLFWALAFVALGHAAMAFVHQFVKHDGTLARMWFGRARAPVPVAAVAPVPPLAEEIPHVATTAPARPVDARGPAAGSPGP